MIEIAEIIVQSLLKQTDGNINGRRFHLGFCYEGKYRVTIGNAQKIEIVYIKLVD